MTPVSLQLIAAGIDSARLAQMATRASHMDRDETRRQLAWMLGMLEPALILLMGAFVLLIVVAILLPVFEMNTLVA